jgi:hypothetical protein
LQKPMFYSKIWMSKLDVSLMSYRLYSIRTLNHSPQSDPKLNLSGKARLPFFFQWTLKKIFAKSSWVAVASHQHILNPLLFYFLTRIVFNGCQIFHLHLDVICLSCESYCHPLSLDFVAFSSI